MKKWGDKVVQFNKMEKCVFFFSIMHDKAACHIHNNGVPVPNTTYAIFNPLAPELFF